MPPGTGSVSIESLPDPLLGRIFAAAGRQAGESITLVSRRWLCVFFSEPALWRELELTAESLDEAEDEGLAWEWFAAKASLLRRVGGFVQQLQYSEFLDLGGDEEVVLGMQRVAGDCGSDWRLGSSVLAHLSPASLRLLRLEGGPVDAAAAAELQRFSGLLGLKYDCRGLFPSCVAAALPSLQRLWLLHLNGDSLPVQLAEALPHMPQLTCLHCSGPKPLLDFSAVQPLTHLRRLVWSEQQQAGSLRLDVQQLLARLPRLEDWTICSFSTRHEENLLVGRALLCSLAVEGCLRAQSTVQAMRLVSIRHMPSLQQLVSASLPSDAQPSWLSSLELSYSELSRSAVQGCSFLGHLTSLRLVYCTFKDGHAAAVTEAMLQQAPRLQRLTLLACFCQQPLPPALLSRTGLLHLNLRRNELVALPPGPYLSSLVSLDLSDNQLTGVPPAMAAATNLTKLSLERNPSMALDEAGVALLLRLPRLQRLYVRGDCAPPHVRARLSQSAPQLEVCEAPHYQV